MHCKNIVIMEGYAPVTLRIKTFRFLSNLAACVLDLLLASHEQQHVATAFKLVNLHHTNETKASIYKQNTVSC